MKANYHTHSQYCGHARGDLIDYIESALSHGFNELGFSEHGPFPGNPFGMRMDYNTLFAYVEELNELKEKYQSKIRIYTGLEIEYFEAYKTFYPLLLAEYGVEYLIMGQHFFIAPGGKCYNLYEPAIPSHYLITHCENMIKGMQTGYFKYIAHPDLMFIQDYQMDANCKKAIDILIAGSEAGNYILELNANGFRRPKGHYSDGFRYPYPVDIFWKEVAKTKIPVIIGADSHSPSDICDEHTDYATEYAALLGLNLIDTLTIK